MWYIHQWVGGDKILYLAKMYKNSACCVKKQTKNWQTPRVVRDVLYSTVQTSLVFVFC